MLFTPTDNSDVDQYLPRIPKVAQNREAVIHASKTEIDVQLTPHMTVNSVQNLREELNINSSLAESSTEQRNTNTVLNSMEDSLYELGINSTCSQLARMQAQSDGNDTIFPNDLFHESAQGLYKVEIQERVMAKSNVKEGAILWLDLNRPSSVNAENLLQRPTLLPNFGNSKDLVFLKQLPRTITVLFKFVVRMRLALSKLHKCNNLMLTDQLLM